MCRAGTVLFPPNAEKAGAVGKKTVATMVKTTKIEVIRFITCSLLLIQYE